MGSFNSHSLYKNIAQKLTVFLSLLVLFTVAAVAANSYVAFAEPRSTSPVVTACKNAVKAKDAQKACDNATNISHARNVASYPCKDEPLEGNKKEDCITRRAIGYVKEAARSNPKTEDAYTKKIDTVLKSKGSDARLTTPEASAGALPSEAVLPTTKTSNFCGGNNGTRTDKDSIGTAIDIGCVGKGNALLDAMFAIIRFLSNGAGLVLILSLIIGGIQYTLSRDDPSGVQAATNRIQSVMIALVIYIFSYAILNYIIPGQLLK